MKSLLPAVVALTVFACSSDSEPGPSPDTSSLIDTVSSEDASSASDDTGATDTGATDTGSGEDTGAGDVGTDAGEPDSGPTWLPAPSELGGDRPASYQVPADYTHSKTWPVVLVLHGYGVTGPIQAAYLGLNNLVDSRGFIMITPTGVLNSDSKHFWNGTDYCCDFENTGVDDVGYLLGLVDELALSFNVDPARIYTIGHSNGGFMSYRLACDAADRVAAIVSIAGATYLDDANCTPSSTVAVAQVHGTEDDTIEYDGEAAKYPSALVTAQTWAAHNGCGEPAEPEAAVEMDGAVSGPDTVIQRWTGCSEGGDVELWTVNGGGHIPQYTDGVFANAALDFLLAH